MPWPSDTGTISTNFQGTTLVTDAVDDHALSHRNAGSLGNQVGSVFGTTPGTNLLVNIKAASDQLVGMNSGGTLNQTFTKGTLNNMLFGTPTIVLGSDATGDMFYRSAAGTVNRVGIGTNTQILTTNGTTPSWESPASLSGALQLGTQITAIGTSSGTATSPFDISSIAFTTTGTTNVLMMAQLAWYNNALVQNQGQILLDGTIQGGATYVVYDQTVANKTLTESIQFWFPNLAAGAHTFKFQGNSSNTGTLTVTSNVLTVLAYNK